MTKTPLLISACLLGEACRYDGTSKPNADVMALCESFEPIPVCPERDGGLPTPRPPCEQKNGRVVSSDGTDCTVPYARGAQVALAAARRNGCRYALLKERSPSCGKGKIYDGTFSGHITSGNGIAAALLMQNGIAVFGESEIPLLLSAYQKETRQDIVP